MQTIDGSHGLMSSAYSTEKYNGKGLPGHQTLNETPVSAVMKRIEQVVVITAHQTVREALQLLTAKGISSAPVFDKEVGRFIGFVDALDLVAFLPYVYAAQTQLPPSDEILKPRFSAQVKDVINASNNDPYLPVTETSSLTSLINGEFRQAVQRVPVIDIAGNLVGIITQRDVVQFLFDHFQSFQPLIMKSVNDAVHLEDKATAISVHKNTIAARGFARLIESGVHGVAVVDDNGKIIGNLSANDLRGITQENFRKLQLPIDELLQDSFYKMPPVFMMSDILLYELIETMLKRKIHRVYITDENQVPLFAVTYSTILRIFARSFPIA